MARKPVGYWEKRSTNLLKAIEKDTQYTIKDLITIYNNASENIQKDIENIFKNFGKKSKLDKKVLEKLLNQKETQTHYNNLLKVINNIKDDDIKNKLLAKYNAPAYAYRISRLQQLKDNIDIELIKLADLEKTITENRYVKTIDEAYYHTIFDIQQGTGVGFTFSNLNMNTVKLMLATNWIDNANFSKRIWKNTKKLGNYLKTNIVADMMTGKSIQRMSTNLSEYMNVGKYNATRLLRTEVNHFANEANALAYEECEVEKYRYIATLDTRTCDKCGSLDNKIFKLSERKTGVNFPPCHTNDRCATVAYYDDEDYSNLKRRARDPKTGKTKLINSNISYEEWRKGIDEEYGEGTFSKYQKMTKNEAYDKKQYENYKKVIGNKNLPETFEKYQEMKYNNIEEYNNLKGYYRYKSNYPQSNKEFYEINNKVKQLINDEKVQSSIGTAIKPNVKDVKISTINIHAEKRMLERNITKNMAQTYIDNAVIEFAQDTKRLYISDKGATVLLKENNRLISTYSNDCFDTGILKILEVINNGK